MKREYTPLLIAVGVILVVLSVFIAYNQWPLLTGKHIVLATRPVDPFDPFRGQYIAINYDISFISNVSGFAERDTVYVSLAKDSQGIWRLAGVGKSKPSQGDFIKGKITSIGYQQIGVEYGIEQYFFERNAELPSTNLTVDAVVDSSGRARITGLLHMGKPVNPSYENLSITS